MEGLERQLIEIVERNREEELHLRKDKGKMENSQSVKISQYDEAMEAKREELESLQKSFDLETREYNILKEYFDKVDADLNRNKEEEEILAAVARREAYAEAVIHRAVAVIQKIARGRRARVEFVKMKSKAKKGKKGGKKKSGNKKKK